MIRIAINGFGRIGRAAFRAALANKNLGERLRHSKRIDTEEISIVAINDLADGEILTSLLRYDSVYGASRAKISLNAGNLEIDDTTVKLLNERDPQNLPWKALAVDVVLECTGAFADFEKARAHLAAGAKRVVISANAKGTGPTVVLGTDSARTLTELAHKNQVFSNASCTTNCIAPIMQILKDRFGVAKSLMTTTHAYTATQNLVDGPHKDLRRARAAAVNTIPTTTGAAKAACLAVPGLEGNFDGIALRIPVTCGSLADITVLLKTAVTSTEVNHIFEEASKSEEYRGIVAYSEDPLVSSDIIGNPHSAVVDGSLTRVVGKDLAKILAWYDNEWAYSCRLLEVAQIIGKEVV